MLRDLRLIDGHPVALTPEEALLSDVITGHFSELAPLDPLSTSAAGYRAQMEAQAYRTELPYEGLPDESADFRPVVFEWPEEPVTARELAGLAAWGALIAGSGYGLFLMVQAALTGGA